MNCLEYQERLQQRLDGDPGGNGDAEIEAHLTQCASCRTLDGAARKLEQGLRLLPSPETPAGLGERVVRQVLTEPTAQRRRQRVWVAVGAVAASLLLALLSGRFRSSPPAPPSEVARQKPEPAEPELVAPVGSLQERMEETGTALAALVSRTADEAVGQGKLLLSEGVPAPRLSSLEDWPPPLEPTALSLREAGLGISAGLEPVASSARRAVNLFLREMPSLPREEDR